MEGLSPEANARSPLPEPQALTVVLNSIFGGNGSSHGPVTIVNREFNVFESTFPSEILMCRFDNGSELQLFCKYSTDEHFDSHGHRGDVEYEAAVYRHLLDPLELSRPGFYGARTDPTTGQTWLFLEYLEHDFRLGKAPDPNAMRLAARWIARFHALHEERLSRPSLGFLNRYTNEYYRGWANRTGDLTSNVHDRFPWLPVVCERFPALIAHLLEQPATIIHGEYYSHNVIFRDGKIYPVDWQSAAIAVGEIDLAALTAAWPAETVEECVVEYRQTRWPRGCPASFQKTLDAARVYLDLRWLGDPSECNTPEGRLEYLEDLRALAERLGLI